jgi:FtsP/CotA-like multicopper oxidase with cupredoxin domain
MPGESAQLLLRFGPFKGLSLYHCHNLDHEDMGMMRHYRVR